MEVKSIFILIIGLLNIILGLVVYLKHHRLPSNFWFFIMCLFGGGWGVTKAFQLSVMDIFWQDQIFVKLVFIFGILSAFAYLMLCYYFPYKTKIYSKKVVFLIVFIPTILIICDIFGILKKYDTFFVNGFPHWEVRFFNFLIFVIYFFLYVLLGASILWKKYFSAGGIHRLQIKYLLMATLGTFITTGYVSVILLLFNNFTYDWLGAVFLSINFIFVGYLIFIRPLNIVIK